MRSLVLSIATVLSMGVSACGGASTATRNTTTDAPAAGRFSNDHDRPADRRYDSDDGPILYGHLANARDRHAVTVAV